MEADGLSHAQSGDARLLASGFLHLMSSQVVSRLISFLVNVFTDRRLNPAEIGLSSVQFPLITATIFSISREGFRRGCLRGHLGGSDSIRAGAAARVVTMAWLAVPLGVIVTVVACAAVLRWQGTTWGDARTVAVLVLGFGTMVEILSEPLYIMAQSLLLLRLRAMVETAANTARVFATYGLLVASIGKDGGLVFAYGQVVYGMCLVCGYWGYFLHARWRYRQSGSDAECDPPTPAALVPLLPCRSRARGDPLLDRDLLRLCGGFTWQSVQKLALGEGEKFVLVLTGSTHNQGMYGLVEKLGSLVVRSFLQPFEESAFTIFARSSADPVAGGKKTDGDQLLQQQHRLAGVERTLLLAIKLASLLGLVLVSFGPSYSYILLRILYGREKSDTEAPAALATYCFYVLFLAANGITEAFLHASVSERQLALSNMAMVAISGVHIGLSVVLIQAAGSVGLILANCCSMALRVAYSLAYIIGYFKDSPTFALSRALPAPRVLATFAAAGLLTRVSEAAFFNRERFGVTAPLHIAVGCACLLLVLGATWRYEQHMLRQLARLRKGGAEPGAHTEPGPGGHPGLQKSGPKES